MKKISLFFILIFVVVLTINLINYQYTKLKLKRELGKLMKPLKQIMRGRERFV